MRKHNRSMLEGPLFSNILLYTLPIMATSILQLLFNAADLVVVGQFRGPDAVAAVGATGALTALIVNLFIGLSVGAGVTVAHGLGGQQDASVHKTVHSSLLLALGSGVVLTTVGVLFSGKFLQMMGTDKDVLPLSTLYMKIYFGGITFTMVYNFCASILRAAGDTKSPLLFLLIAGVVNVGLNVIFITVFGMNVDGVALATVISQAISAILVVIALMRRTDACKLQLSKLRFYGAQVKKILSIGIPAGIQSSLFSISNVMIQSSINSFGKVVMAGHAAAGNLEGFVYVLQNAFQQTAVNFIGQNAGAHQFDRIKKIFRTCLIMVAITGILSGGLMFLFGRTLLGIYLPNANDAIDFGILRLAMVGIPYFICGLMDVSTGGLRGLGSSVAPMIISILGVCGIRLFWIFTIFPLPQFHSPEWLYFSYIISWTITFIIQFITFISVYKKEKSKYKLSHI